jgi:hypothetical protein
MVWSVVLVVLAAVLAAVAGCAAILATRALREVKKVHAHTLAALATPEPEASRDVEVLAETRLEPLIVEHDYRVVEGRVIVMPTQADVSAAVMTQPRIRAAIWLSGIAHALRPESRDRIAALMRREYRARRRSRLRAAKAAARTANSTGVPS